MRSFPKGGGCAITTAMHRHLVTADQLRKERRWFTPRQMAQARGISVESMRSRLSYYGIKDVTVQDPEVMVSKLWTRGTVEEIAEYMELSKDAVQRVCVSMGLRQLSLWPAIEHRTKVQHEPRMRVVHTRSKYPRPVQLSLFTEIEQSLAA